MAANQPRDLAFLAGQARQVIDSVTLREWNPVEASRGLRKIVDEMQRLPYDERVRSTELLAGLRVLADRLAIENDLAAARRLCDAVRTN